MSTFTPFSFESRQSILQECVELICWLHDFADGYHLHSIRGTPAFIEALQYGHAQKDRLRSLAQQYSHGLPTVPLSRCPYCQIINHLPFDHYNLDGLWWHYEQDVRARGRQQLCPHFLTLSGAVKLADEIIWSPIEVLPGPEVPFIVPHMLQDDSIKAVISQINVGAHTTYPIVYFSQVKPVKIENPVCEWGKNVAVLVQKDGEFQSLLSSYYRYLDKYGDFDLAPWIARGKVLWIEPDDELFNLRSESDDQCPYLNLSGNLGALKLRQGCVWSEGKRIRGELKPRK